MGDPQPPAQTINVLKRKALGFIQGIEKMGSSEQMENVGLATAQDFDHLVQSFIVAVPQLETLAPPRTTPFSGTTGYEKTHVHEKYAEILIRTEQIYQMLDGLENETGT